MFEIKNQFLVAKFNNGMKLLSLVSKEDNPRTTHKRILKSWLSRKECMIQYDIIHNRPNMVLMLLFIQLMVKFFFYSV